jgi:hypothetical protein
VSRHALVGCLVAWLVALLWAASRPGGTLAALAVWGVLSAVVLVGSVAGSLAMGRALSRRVTKDQP